MNVHGIKKAVKWSMICEIIAKIIAPITTIVLARLLSQEVFGIVASLTAITTLADLLADAGFNAYIIQHQFANDKEKIDVYNICFWSNLIISLFLFGVIACNRDVFSMLVGAEGYGNVLIIASLVIPLVSVSSVEMAIMKRDLNFKSLGLIKVTSKIIPFVTTIPFALLGFGFWSLILGSLIGEAVGCILCLMFSGFLPSFSYNTNYLGRIFSFSSWAYIESILEWLLFNVPVLVLASVYGISELGVFKVGLNVINQITSSIYALYSNVYKSAISREQNNIEGFRTIFLTFQKYASLVSLPLGIGVLLYRNLVTTILLGSQWGEASVIVGIWGVMATLSISYGNFYSDAIRAKGYPKILVVIDFIYLFFIVLLLVNAYSINFVSFCIVFCLLKGIQPLLQIAFGRVICQVDFLMVLKNSYPQIFASLVMGGMIWLLRFDALDFAGSLMSIVFCVVIYFSVFFVLSPERALYKNYLCRLIKKK